MSIKLGRPTKYTDDMPQKVIDLMAKGYSKSMCAAELGFSEDTFFRWQKENEIFSEAIKIGEGLSALWWQKKGLENLFNKDFNFVGWYMQMKNRFGWSDKQQIQHTIEKSRIVIDVGSEVIDDAEKIADQRD